MLGHVLPDSALSSHHHYQWNVDARARCYWGVGGGGVCLTTRRGSVLVLVVCRHVRGSRKWIPGSDPKDLDPGSVRIIDQTLTVCRQIHWDHGSSFA